MPPNPLRLIAPLALLVTMTACATPGPQSVEPPRLTLPKAAETTCTLDRLPPAPTEADLETGYARRGASIVLCDAARDLAVQTLIAERELQDRWREQQNPRPWWRIFTGG